NGSSLHSRKACLQEIQNPTFFEDIELTARPFQRGQKSALCAAEDSQGSHGVTSLRKLLPFLNLAILKRRFLFNPCRGYQLRKFSQQGADFEQAQERWIVKISSHVPVMKQTRNRQKQR